MTATHAPHLRPGRRGGAAARFAATAPADVSYALVDSPVGTLVAAQTERGLACLAYEDLHGGADALLERIAAEISPRVLLAPAKLDECGASSTSTSRGRARTST